MFFSIKSRSLSSVRIIFVCSCPCNKEHFCALLARFSLVQDSRTPGVNVHVCNYWTSTHFDAPADHGIAVRKLRWRQVLLIPEVRLPLRRRLSGQQLLPVCARQGLHRNASRQRERNDARWEWSIYVPARQIYRLQWNVREVRTVWGRVPRVLRDRLEEGVSEQLLDMHRIRALLRLQRRHRILLCTVGRLRQEVQRLPERVLRLPDTRAVRSA